MSTIDFDIYKKDTSTQNAPQKSNVEFDIPFNKENLRPSSHPMEEEKKLALVSFDGYTAFKINACKYIP